MNRISTKLFAVILLPVMVFSLSGCGSYSKIGREYNIRMHIFICLMAGVLIQEAEFAKMYMKQNTHAVHGVQAADLHMIRQHSLLQAVNIKEEVIPGLN